MRSTQSSRRRAAIIDTGRDLLTIKEQLDHGLFGAWLEAEFGMSRRSAQNYMSAALQFDGKSETVSHLPARAIYQLSSASTPEPVREELISRLQTGERVKADEIRHRIWPRVRPSSSTRNGSGGRGASGATNEIERH
jgi:hypothetical protein